MRVIVFEPATAVTVPPHPPTSPFGVATTRPAGNGSVKFTPVRLFPKPRLISNVSVVVSVTSIDPTANVLVKDGGAAAAAQGTKKARVPIAKAILLRMREPQLLTNRWTCCVFMVAVPKWTILLRRSNYYRLKVVVKLA